MKKGSSSGKYPWTLRRIIAVCALALLALLYVVTIIAALTASPGADDLFRFCIGMTVAVPIMAWILLWAAGHFR